MNCQRWAYLFELIPQINYPATELDPEDREFKSLMRRMFLEALILGLWLVLVLTVHQALCKVLTGYVNLCLSLSSQFHFTPGKSLFSTCVYHKRCITYLLLYLNFKIKSQLPIELGKLFFFALLHHQEWEIKLNEKILQGNIQRIA